MFLSLIVIAAAVAVLYFLEWSLALVGTGTLVALWPCWWGVLTSMALGGIAPDTTPIPFYVVEAWYGGSWFKWLVELGLLGLFNWTWWRNRWEL